MASAVGQRPKSPSPSQLPPVPGSPTYSYTSTANPATGYNLPLPPPPPPPHAILSKQDLANSQQAYADLISSAKVYRQALASLSTAASAFGSALESCARLKEARAEKAGMIPIGVGMTTSFITSPSGPVTADTLLAAAGLHHLIANHQQILSETVYRSFEVPLLDDLDKWQHAATSENESYAQAVQNASKDIKKLEKEGTKLQKARRRDVGKFRAHLVELTGKLDGLTQLHTTHAMTLLRESQDTSLKITEAACSLVRAEVDIFESLARKGWSGGGLEDVLEKGTDLFAPEDIVPTGTGIGMVGSGGSDGLFSILPPKSILADATLAERNGAITSHRLAGHMRADSILSDPICGDSKPAGRDIDASTKNDLDSDSVFSETKAQPVRRPFSPQPIRRVPTDVTYDSLSGGLGIGQTSVREVPSLNEGAGDQDDGHGATESTHFLYRDERELTKEKKERQEGNIQPYELGNEDDQHPWRDEGLQRHENNSRESPADSQSEGKQSSERWTTVRHSDGE